MDSVLGTEDKPAEPDVDIKTNDPEKKTGENEDPMLSFLTLLSKVERASCSNCDARDSTPMFFCNTCSQTICAKCRDDTHKSKMFTYHDVTTVSTFTKEPQRKCTIHNELYIMYSPANESLLCINCFRDLSPEARAQCVDLETSYTEHCNKLQKSIKSVNEIELKLKEEVIAYHNHLKNLHMNAMREESTIHVFSKILRSTITQIEEKLIDSLKRELQVKEKVLDDKLRTLEQLLNNIQAYVSLTTAFISSASKYELLKLASGLVDRLNTVGSLVQPFTISPECSAIQSNFKNKFAHSLRSLLQQECWEADPAVELPPSHEIQEEAKTAPEDPTSQATAKLMYKSHSLPNLSLDTCIPVLPAQDIADSVSAKPNKVREVNQSTKPATLKKEKKLRKSRTLDKKDVYSRSKSSDPPVQKSVHQMELFATIQSRKAVTRGSKNLFVTSLVGVRQSDNRKTTNGEESLPSVKGTTQLQSGHVCVVQAMVHQDGVTPADSKARKRPAEPNHEPSIELTPAQFQELMKAITAAQRTRPEPRPRSAQEAPGGSLPRDVEKAKKLLKRTDSFEGHEEAVRMLVDAVRELRQICCSKGSCEHL